MAVFRRKNISMAINRQEKWLYKVKNGEHLEAKSVLNFKIPMADYFISLLNQVGLFTTIKVKRSWTPN